jgi:hypothetical protein
VPLPEIARTPEAASKVLSRRESRADRWPAVPRAAR